MESYINSERRYFKREIEQEVTPVTPIKMELFALKSFDMCAN